MKKFLALLFSLLFLSNAFTQSQSDTLEIISMQSTVNGGLYQLYIRTPPNYEEGQRHPAIIILEANYYHRTFTNIYDSIVSQNGDHSLIIGIGYLPNPMNDNLFMRDFTPTHIDGYPNSGKAEEFKQILDTELVPMILSHYRIDESRLSIVGHHYSALFLTWLLTHESPKFSNYIICSPVLTFNEDFTDFKINDFNTGIYLSMGSGKIKYVDDPELNKSKFKSLVDQLENKNLKVSHFESPLRYDDLQHGFAEGINFILSQTDSNGSMNDHTKFNPEIILNKSSIIIDQVIDEITSYPYEISVHLPFTTPEEKLPVIVVLDADFNYTELLYAYQELLEKGLIPKSVIVGVGYGTTIIGRGNFRNRDLIPYPVQDLESGNGENFAAFLDEQLINYLDRYPVDKGEMTLQGHSYGGLFLTYLLTRGDLAYQNLIISSPALWQDRAVLKGLKKLDKPIPQSIYLASGQIEDNDKDAKQLDKVLSKIGLLHKTVLYSNDSHLTVISEAFERALIYFSE